MNDNIGKWIEEKLENTSKPEKIKLPSLDNNQNKSGKKTANFKKAESKKTFSKKRTFHGKPSGRSGTKHRSKSSGKPTNIHANKHAKPSNKAPKKFKEGNIKGKLRIIPLGGLNEVGKNMTVFEFEDDIIIVDMGFQFPEEDMLGIDYVIPDVSWLEERKHKIRGVIFTHGHLDHIGAVPYLLPKLNYPKLYGTKLTLGLIEKKIEEFGIKKDTLLRVIDPDETIKLGKFTLNFFRVNHSIPDGVGVIIKSPAGLVVHTGDFKFDYTPSDGVQTDFDKLGDLSVHNNVDILFSDSTNSMKPGKTISEKTIGENLDKIIGETNGRIIIASFSSLIGRIQQILTSAAKHKRKVFISGRSLENNIEIAMKLGYIKMPKDLVHDIKHLRKTNHKNALILTTGSQGEAMSALTRISLNNHKFVKVRKGDTIVFSSSPIIGNERAIYNVIDNLVQAGAKVIHNKIMDVHTSGHGYQDDLKLMIELVKPKHFVPIHGQYHMRATHKDLAIETGIREENTTMLVNGDILELHNGKVTKSKETADTNYILVDGLGMGDSGSKVLFERQMLAENGVIIMILNVDRRNKKLIGNPQFISKGFIYMKESEKILKDLTKQIQNSYQQLLQKNPKPGEQNTKDYIRSVIDKFTHKKLARRPLIVPIVVEK